jgi:hypothetical protein
MPDSRPFVLFSITTGWGIRNFVHTGMIDAIGRFADVGVAATSELLPFFQSAQTQGRIAWTGELISSETPFWRTVRRAKKATLQSLHDISTARIKWNERAESATTLALAKATWGLQRAFAAQWQLDGIEALEARFAPGTVANGHKRPSLFVNGSPFDPRDIQLQRTLQREGVRTVAVIPSWDNPSTKGRIIPSSDRIVAWGPQQRDELLNFYPGLERERIAVCGIPQFDDYDRPFPNAYAREPFLESMGIRPDQRVILYATCSARLFPGEPEVVASIAEALEQGRFGPQAHLLVRCHPADRAERYTNLEAAARVSIVPSSVAATRTLATWTPPGDELARLAATLRYSDVCINTASTMTLDALACGKPVINVAYDGNNERPYSKSVRRYYDYFHYAPIARSGAVVVADSAETLLAGIDDALKQPLALETQREQLLQAYCYRPAEGSVQSIVNLIAGLVEERTT